jgi:hypothetical protein
VWATFSLSLCIYRSNIKNLIDIWSKKIVLDHWFVNSLFIPNFANFKSFYLEKRLFGCGIYLKRSFDVIVLLKASLVTLGVFCTWEKDSFGGDLGTQKCLVI